MKKTKLLPVVLLLGVLLVMTLFAVTASAEGGVVKIGETEYATLADAITASTDGNTITILANGTYTLSSFSKELTIKAADGVEATIDVASAVGLPNSKVVFENLIFDYYPNQNYVGLQHTDTMTYNNCVINGQIFLYGNTETFNNCTFNQDSADYYADYYNVWTYGAKQVEFNNCKFNCVGKSVLVYNEGGNGSAIEVADCEFVASAPTKGKAAIEIDSSLLAGGKAFSISTTGETTATGFATGSNSGSTLWNDKKGTSAEVTVNGEKVLSLPSAGVASFDGVDYPTLSEAIAAATAGSTITLLDNVTCTGAIVVTGVTLDLSGKTLTLADNANNEFRGTCTIKNGTISIDGVEVGGNCIIGVGMASDSTLNLENVNLTGSNYSSAFAVIMVYGNNALNVTGGEWTLSNELGALGGVIKNQNGAGTSGQVNITGTKMTFDNVSRGIAGSTTVLDSVNLTITGGDNGINGVALTVKDSSLSITGGTGRALTVTGGDVTVINSTLNFADNAEADIRFKSSNTLSVDATSTLNECSVFADSSATDAKINDKAITGTEAEQNTVSVASGITTVTSAWDGVTIASLENLIAFRDAVNAGDNYKGKTVTLTADIDLAGIEWTPIGNSTNKFEGYFDGGNHTIDNLTIASPASDYVGLFGFVKGTSMSATATPTVKDLKLTNVSVAGGSKSYVGALAGKAYTCNITNVTVQGEVGGYRYVGGLVGHVYTYFKDCKFEGTASCSFDALGGIAGAGDCRAYDCVVIGTVSGRNLVGGIIGNGQEGTSAVNCYVKANVSSSSSWYAGVGGIAGFGGHGYTSSAFKNNYFDGVVTLCGEKMNSPIVGTVNNSVSAIKTVYEGNAWNTENYPADLVAGLVSADDQATADMTATQYNAVVPFQVVERNNNLVVLESDLAYIDATDAADVTIMQIEGITEVTEEQVAAAIADNSKPVKIGDVKYATLAEAVAAAQAGNTITLVNDIIGISTVTIPAEKSITIDLCGHTIEAAVRADNAAKHYYAIDNYGTLVLNDSVGGGTIKARGIENLGDGVMTINGGTYQSIDEANGGAAVWNEATLTVNGGTFVSTYRGSSSDTYGAGCLNNSGTALITGGTFTGNSARTYAIISTGSIEITPAEDKEVTVWGVHGGFAVDAGTAVINGGSYDSEEYYGVYVSNDGTGSDPSTAAVTINGGNFKGHAYSVWIGSDHNNPVNSTIAITGGTFEKPMNAQENTREGAIAVSGGTFSVAVPAEYCAEGFAPVANEDGTYTVEEKAPEFDGLSLNMLVIRRGVVNGYYELAILSGIDTLNYAEVGFDVEVYNNGTLISSGNYNTKTVYRSVTDGAGKTWYPNDEQLNAANCNYLFANVMKIAETNKDAFSSDAYVKVTPYAKALDGTKLTRSTFEIPVSIFFGA